jgi:hypothetical protein
MNERGTTVTDKYWMGGVPTRCQISDQPIKTMFVDGRVPRLGIWAIMTPGTFRENGGTLGLGRGQLYEKQSDGRWKKIDG